MEYILFSVLILLKLGAWMQRMEEEGDILGPGSMEGDPEQLRDSVLKGGNGGWQEVAEKREMDHYKWNTSQPHIDTG